MKLKGETTGNHNNLCFLPRDKGNRQKKIEVGIGETETLTLACTSWMTKLYKRDEKKEEDWDRSDISLDLERI